MSRLIALFVMLLAIPASAAEIYTPITTHTLDATGTSQTISTSFGAHTRVMRIHAREDIFFAVGSISGGATPTASSLDHFLPADTTEYFLVNPGSDIAVISNGTTGEVFIMELSK